MDNKSIKLKVFLLLFFHAVIINAQFLDEFDKDKIQGWFFFTGDGEATMDFIQKEGFARITVDATKDKYNVWWAIIKRDISSYIELRKLKDPNYELRVEAKIRISHSPRRINFMLNTQRTTDFHEHLMEYDIPDTNNWHVISYTTKNFEAFPGDSVYVQLGVTDFGLDKYYVDIDYYRADIVDITNVKPDIGELVPYHPPIPEIDFFEHQLVVAHDALINSEFPDVNFNDWQAWEKNNKVNIITINANQWAILRWDFEKFKNIKIDGSGLLELTTYSIFKGGNYIAAFGEDLGVEFGKIRVIEILKGDSSWDQNNVTYNSLMQDATYSGVFNTQMIFDVEPNYLPEGKTFITISKPVLQRMIDGRTKGLMIRPLGSLTASFYSLESGKDPATLYFNSVK